MTARRVPLADWLHSDAPQSRAQARAISLWAFLGRLFENRLTLAGLAILLLFLFMAAFSPLLATHDPLEQDLSLRLSAPGENGFLLGSDELGRDIWSRLVHGAGPTLAIVALVVATAPVLGLIVGTVAGYLGGWPDRVLMRITDVFFSFPKLLLALAFVAVLGPGLENLVLAIAITAWPPYARVARAETLTVRREEYIEAVILQGARWPVIVFRHVWPLCMGSVLVRMTLDMAGIIITAASLGFLGLGLVPPTPEWGAMIASGRNFALTHWWVSGVPGIAVVLVCLGFNFLGDGLRDALEPKRSQL